MNDKKQPIESMDPVDTIFNFLIEGNGNSDIIEYLAQQKVSPEQASEHFETALNKFIKASKLPRIVRQGWCLEAMRELYRRMLETGDYSGALRAVQEIAKLSHADKAGIVETPDDDVELKDEVENYIDKVMAL